MAWSKEQHDRAVRDAVLAEDWDRVEKLAQEAVDHDREVARLTGEIAWKHKKAG